MKFLDKNESAEFVYTKDTREFGERISYFSDEIQFDTSNFLNRSYYLARFSNKLVGENQKCFLWITEFGIWPSLENLHLFECLRKFDNESRQLSKTPGHIFEANEQNTLLSYLQLVIIFGWGGVLLGIENRNRLIISHDSWMSIYSQSDISLLESFIKSFDLPCRVAKRAHNTLEALHLPPYEVNLP